MKILVVGLDGATHEILFDNDRLTHCPTGGKRSGVHRLDIAPTLRELGGDDVPGSMQGKSLVSGWAARIAAGFDDPTAGEDDELVRSRLGGLGYLS